MRPERDAQTPSRGNPTLSGGGGERQFSHYGKVQDRKDFKSLKILYGGEKKNHEGRIKLRKHSTFRKKKRGGDATGKGFHFKGEEGVGISSSQEKKKKLLSAIHTEGPFA